MGHVNETDVEWDDYEQGSAAFRRRRLGRAAGGDALGCSLYELPAGGRSWAYHYHTANEEALYVLAGEGTLRLADRTRSLSPGDYVAFAADEDGAHRVVNDGDRPVRYLMMSTMIEPDVTVYPDSRKIGVFTGAPPGGAGERSVGGFFRLDDDVDYWEGEDG